MISEINLFSFWRIVAYGAAVVLFIPGVRVFAENDTVLYSAYLFSLSFILCFIFMPFLIWMGERLGLVDSPDEERKRHKRPTALTGGIVIYCAFVATMLLNFHFSVEIKAVLVSSTIIFLVGLADDRWGTTATLRLIVQVGASLFLALYGVRVTFVPVWLGGIYADIIITVIWIIGITNSMNFIDGMDGLAAGSSIIYSLFFAIIGIITKQYYMLFLTIVIAGSCMGFFLYNFRKNKPALVFLGDSGSTFLGFLLASFAILGTWGPSIVDIVIPVLIMSVLIFDMSLTTIVRIYTKEVRNFGQWLHYTGRDHFHHRLEGLGITRNQATGLFFAFSICFGIEALAILFASVLVAILILVHTVLTFIIIGTILVVRNKNPDENAKTRNPYIERLEYAQSKESV
jgi:UDP-N-acetylmuramyl pentapeptide phosphotransferase/UDP-N-acetylglucosamine-1-phosphate transferase